MQVLDDYSFIKGVNYNPRGSETDRRNLGYAKRIGLNSVRFWMRWREYEKDPEGYLQSLKNFVEVLEEMDFTCVPIFFNGNELDPANLKKSWYPEGEKFAGDVIDAIGSSRAVLMWDVMNEPACNDYINKSVSASEREERLEKLWKFVRHFCCFVKEKDPDNAITVGHYLTKYLPETADLVDVISYHNYSETEAKIRQAAEEALAVANQYHKKLINNEMSCVARANPYDLSIRVMDEYGIPYYVFCLMIEGYWGEIHGIFYPDGTVRDPSIPAAIVGCFRNRDLKTMVPEKPNREACAERVLKDLQKLLTDSNDQVFSYSADNRGTEALLDAMETAANLMESAQMVPMRIPPTARIRAWREEENPNPEDVRDYAWELAKLLEKNCHLL
jgi:hypothetical protein